MRSLLNAFFAAGLVASIGAVSALSAAEPIKGLGPIGEPKLVQGGFEFTEGPARDAAGNLYFTDIPANAIHKLDPEGKISLFTDQSGHSNGLMVNLKTNELFACEMDGQVVAWNLDTHKRRVVASQYKGKRFNAPNDLVFDSQGGFYFTDPEYRAPMPFPQGGLGVYYVAPDGTVTRVIEHLKNPNGVILSPDEKTLYIIPSSQAEMLSYPVEAPGKLGAMKVFCTLKQPKGASGGGGDGLTVDEKGNLYITTALGLQVYSPAGELLGVIELPEHPANCTFGGPENKTIYATARKGLYSVEMEVAGHVYGPKK